MTFTLPASVPPIECLVAAIIAARCGSFTQAAVELNVSHAAISRRIMSAESWAGIKLFQRHGRGVTVTLDGQRLLARVSHALEIVDQAADVWRKPLRQRTLKIATTHSVARLWLIPRIAELERRVPLVRIEVISGNGHTDLNGGDADIVIRCGKGGWKIGTERRLFPEERSFPVASTAYLAEIGPIESAGRLLTCNLIHNVDSTTWRAWAQEQGATIKPKTGDRIMGDHSQSLVAAEAGLGVALFAYPVTPLEMLNDTLVRIDLPSITNPLSYFVIMRSDEISPAIISVANALTALGMEHPTIDQVKRNQAKASERVLAKT
jgi:LysR family transcriptional regulator, glycine cleavage system transcriptional activator